MSKPTPGPWEWNICDYSMATLEGPGGDEQQVMSVSPCKSCCDYATKRNDEPEWEWGRCMTPSEADARLMSAAPELLKACQYVMRQLILGDKVRADELIDAITKATGVDP